MTDDKREAPERIWAWETLNCNGQWTIAEGDGIEYVRADTIDTLTAERDALRELVEHAFREGFDMAAGSTRDMHFVMNRKNSAWRHSLARAALKGD